jgi:hypothetical protein
MNQNDMDRYLWRTSRRWSGDDRPFRTQRAGRKLMNRTILLVAAAFAMSIAMLFLQR